MRAGHRLTALGALLLALGALALPWQRFVLTDLTVSGWAVPTAGQPLVALAALLLVAGLVGLATRPRKAAAVGALVLSVAALAWVIAADLSRGDVLELPPAEVVEMLGGHTMALVGALTALAGAIIGVAADPAAEPDAPLLRLAVVWRGDPVAERVLTAGRSLTLGEAPDNDLVLPGPGLPATMTLVHPRRDGFVLTAPATASGHATVAGAARELASEPTPLSPGDWGALELGEATLAFEVERPERRRELFGRPRFNDVVAAAVAVSAVVQCALVLWATLSWQEQARRDVVHNERLQPQVEAVVRGPERAGDEAPEVGPR